MPERRKRSKKAVVDATGEDRISALPDAILQVVLSFLPSDETVQTCALSRRWRHLWKSTPALRILHTDLRYWSVKEMNVFVNYLLLLRDRVPLDECEISYRGQFSDEEHADIVRFSGMWIHYALSLCRAQVLKVSVGIPLTHGNSALVSRFLRRLELRGVSLCEHAIDFSGCPKLEDLNLRYCAINGHKISAKSVRRLSIIQCAINLVSDTRIRISAPCLVFLQLDGVRGGVSLLESMTSLVTAYIRLGGSYLDSCSHVDYRDCDDCLAYDDDGGGGDGNGCVLLQGLSGATSLELITTDRDVFIFRKDLKQCPTFSMLKTLLLNEWCVAADFGALACFLQHTPVLEKLVLQLRLDVLQIWKFVTKIYESYNPTVQFLVLKHLKVVEIRCEKEDEQVRQIVKILSTFGVSSDRIDVQVIQHTYFSEFSPRFSFEQT